MTSTSPCRYVGPSVARLRRLSTGSVRPGL